MTLIYAPHRGRPIPWPHMSSEHYAAKARCAAYCKEIQNLTGSVVLSEPAIKLFTDWYINVKDKKMRQASGVMAEYYGALNIQVLKVACLLAFADRPEKLIEAVHITEAITMLEELEPSIMTILGGGGRNDLAPHINAIEDFIKQKGRSGASLKFIQTSFYNQVKLHEFTEILSYLTTTGSIVLDNVEGKPVYIYKPA